MHSEVPARMVVLGLDGLPYSLARELCASGCTPNLARLMPGCAPVSPGKAHGVDPDVSQPAACSIRAELPDLSPVNWTSFYTAQGPEEHGVFGFTRIHAIDYTMALADFAQVAVPTLFDRMGERGLTSRVVNLPNTYPAWPIPGMLISGFVAHDLARAVHPPFLLGPLMGAGYILESDTTNGVTDPQGLLAGLARSLDGRRGALNLLWPDLAWNLFVFVLTETDRLFHFLWDGVTDSAHPQHAGCMALLAQWDALVGDVLDRVDALPGGGRLMVLADHGFTGLITEVDINAWLREKGYLQLTCAPEAAPELDGTLIRADSTAFALDPGRIYLHTRRRFGNGCLSDEEAATLARRIGDELMQLAYDGAPVLRAVHTADALYPGTLRDVAPDLVCEAHRGFDLKAKFNRTAVFGHFGRTGTHTVDDAFFYDSYGSRPATVRGAGAEVLAHFGLSAPTGKGAPSLIMAAR